MIGFDGTGFLLIVALLSLLGVLAFSIFDKDG